MNAPTLNQSNKFTFIGAPVDLICKNTQTLIPKDISTSKLPMVECLHDLVKHLLRFFGLRAEHNGIRREHLNTKLLTCPVDDWGPVFLLKFSKGYRMLREEAETIVSAYYAYGKLQTKLYQCQNI